MIRKLQHILHMIYLNIKLLKQQNLNSYILNAINIGIIFALMSKAKNNKTTIAI